MQAPRACLAVLRSAAVELERVAIRFSWVADIRESYGRPARTGEVLDLHELHLGPHAEVLMRMNVFYEFLMDSKSVKDQVHDVVVNLCFLCAFRAVRPWISLWYYRTVRKRLKKDACEVMQLTGSAHEHVTAQVHSFL